MRAHTAGVLLLLAAPALAQEAGPGRDAPREEPDVARLFAESCASCHQPPDPTFAVDRAWITQLADTA